jgi:pyruvate dehydrogenase E1 component alpha subunit
VRAATIDTPDPAPNELFEHVYTTPHPLITEQRRAYTEYLAGDPGGASARGEGVPR